LLDSGRWRIPYDSEKNKDHCWEGIPASLQHKARDLNERLLAFANQLVPLVKSSPLNSEADQQNLMGSLGISGVGGIGGGKMGKEAN